MGEGDGVPSDGEELVACLEEGLGGERVFAEEDECTVEGTAEDLEDGVHGV